MDEDDWRPKKSGDGKITVGEDLANLSVNDLLEREKALLEEIERVKKAVKDKQRQASAAASLFDSGQNAGKN